MRYQGRLRVPLMAILDAAPRALPGRHLAWKRVTRPSWTAILAWTVHHETYLRSAVAGRLRQTVIRSVRARPSEYARTCSHLVGLPTYGEAWTRRHKPPGQFASTYQSCLSGQFAWILHHICCLAWTLDRHYSCRDGTFTEPDKPFFVVPF